MEQESADEPRTPAASSGESQPNEGSTTASSEEVREDVPAAAGHRDMTTPVRTTPAAARPVGVQESVELDTQSAPASILRPVPEADVEVPPPLIGGVKETSWTPARSQEFVRSVLALSLVALLAGIIIVSFALVALKSVAVADMDTIMKIVFAPVIGLVGSVVGFYFGAEVASRNSGT